jgi:hypothetical protein
MPDNCGLAFSAPAAQATIAGVAVQMNRTWIASGVLREMDEIGLMDMLRTKFG